MDHKKIFKYFLWFTIAIFLLALISLSTVMVWDGGYPSGEIVMKLEDKEGNSIEGATINIFKKGTKENAYGYPFENYRDGEVVKSDENGILKLWLSSKKSGNWDKFLRSKTLEFNALGHRQV